MQVLPMMVVKAEMLVASCIQKTVMELVKLLLAAGAVAIATMVD